MYGEIKMISKALVDEMNEQIMHELYSSHLYLAMAAYCEEQNLPGFGKWLMVQAGEEHAHAMKFFGFLVERGARPLVKAVPQPPSEFKSALDIFSQTYEHEQKVTARIHHLYALALKESDYPSQVFLQWFVNEQVEEEKNASYVEAVLKKIGESVGGLYQLDHQLGKRGE
jgi:ferritin